MTIKIFIGTSPNGEDKEIEEIYEHTLRENSKENIEIHWMKLSNDKNSIWGGWNTTKWFTPFSGLRWAIPHACNFEGKAIYTDVDMINFKDIKELFNLELKGKPFAARKGPRWGHELCVMLIDCQLAKKYIWDIEKLKRRKDSHSFHRNLIASNPMLIQEIDSRWNCLDGEDRKIEDIYQLHFTNMSSQPWSPIWYKGEKTPHSRKDIIEKYNELKSIINSKKKGGAEPVLDDKEIVDYEILL